MLTMNDKVHNLLIYRCFNQKWKNILEIFCIKIYSIIVFQNNGGVFKICNKSRIFYPFFIKLPPNDTKYLFIRVIIRKVSKMNLSSFRWKVLLIPWLSYLIYWIIVELFRIRLWLCIRGCKMSLQSHFCAFGRNIVIYFPRRKSLEGKRQEDSFIRNS